MTTCYFETLAAFAVSCLLSAMIIPKISLIAFRRRLSIRWTTESCIRRTFPVWGGIAFFPCIIMPISLVIACHNLCTDSNLLSWEQSTCLLTLFSCLFMLYLMGMRDDLIGMRYRAKFIIQTLCGLLLVASGFCFDNLYGLFGIYELPYYVGIPFTVFIIVYIMNAINLIDGIDGLASGLSMIAFFAFGCMFVCLHWWLYAFISFAALGALIPFFYYNMFGQTRRGRKVFMGDTGSLTIGLLLAVMAIHLSMSDPVKEELFPGAIVTAFSFLLVPMLDVVRVVLHRLRNHQPPFLPDKNHIHHKFIALGMSQHQALCFILSIAWLFIIANTLLASYLSVTVLFLLDVAVWTAMHFYITANYKKTPKKLILHTLYFIFLFYIKIKT